MKRAVGVTSSADSQLLDDQLAQSSPNLSFVRILTPRSKLAQDSGMHIADPQHLSASPSVIFKANSTSTAIKVRLNPVHKRVMFVRWASRGRLLGVTWTRQRVCA